MKKINFWLLVVALFILSLICGCAGSDNAQQRADAQKKADSALAANSQLSQQSAAPTQKRNVISMDVAKTNLENDLVLASQMIAETGYDEFHFSKLFSEGLVAVVKAESNSDGSLRIYDIIPGKSYSIMFALVKDVPAREKYIPKNAVMVTGDIFYMNQVPVILVHTPKFQTAEDSSGQGAKYYHALCALHEMVHGMQRVVGLRMGQQLTKENADNREVEAFNYEIKFVPQVFAKMGQQIPVFPCDELPDENGQLHKKMGSLIELAALYNCGSEEFVKNYYNK